MKAEQEDLILKIISRLDRGSVTGEWSEQKCSHCNGTSTGYYDSQGFDHTDDCIDPLIHELRLSMYKES